jgi:hypothetical protein
MTVRNGAIFPRPVEASPRSLHLNLPSDPETPMAAWTDEIDLTSRGRLGQTKGYVEAVRIAARRTGEYLPLWLDPQDLLAGPHLHAIAPLTKNPPKGRVDERP